MCAPNTSLIFLVTNSVACILRIHVVFATSSLPKLNTGWPFAILEGSSDYFGRVSSPKHSLGNNCTCVFLKKYCHFCSIRKPTQNLNEVFERLRCFAKRSEHHSYGGSFRDTIWMGIRSLEKEWVANRSWSTRRRNWVRRIRKCSIYSFYDLVLAIFCGFLMSQYFSVLHKRWSLSL